MTRNVHLLLSIGLAASVSAYSQSVRGTILGTVTDASGAVVRGAKVTAIQITTGLTRTELTNGEGEYSIPQLPVGPYTVTAEQPGFKKTERSASINESLMVVGKKVVLRSASRDSGLSDCSTGSGSSVCMGL